MYGDLVCDHLSNFVGDKLNQLQFTYIAKQGGAEAFPKLSEALTRGLDSFS